MLMDVSNQRPTQSAWCFTEYSCIFKRKEKNTSEGLSTRSFASPRIHVKRCISHITNIAILKLTLSLRMSCVANQIECVCAWQTGFQPEFVPLDTSDKSKDSSSDGELEVETYLTQTVMHFISNQLITHNVIHLQYREIIILFHTVLFQSKTIIQTV